MKQDLQERWFNWWEDDDGFNIKAGARQDKMDIFFMPDKSEDEQDNENTPKTDK